MFGNRTLNTPGAYRHASLPHLLSNHVGTGIRVKETMSDNLSYDLVCSHIVGLRPGFFGHKTAGSVPLEVSEQLEIPLLGIAVLLSSLRGAQPQTAALKKHGQLPSQSVISLDRQRAPRAKKQGSPLVCLLHGYPPSKSIYTEGVDRQRITEKSWLVK